MKFFKLTGKIVILLLFVPGVAWAQKEDEKPTLDNGTVEEQFEYVLDKSHTYEEYRVIKSYMFNKLKKQVEDTMKVVHSTIDERNLTIREKNTEIDSLKQMLAATNDKLALAIQEKNTLTFVGISMSKGAYNSIVWLIIAGLLFGLVLFLFLYKRSHNVIKEVRNDLEDTKEEFEKHRKRALEREEQVVRKYHDELTKYKEKAMKQN